MYWKNYLSDHEEKTPLPMSHLSPQQDVVKAVFETAEFCLSEENTTKLEALVKTHRLTMNTVLQFIWGLLLHLHSGNKSVTFGSVSSGRTGIVDIKHSDQMVGLCANTTPTCIKFDFELNFLEQLKQMQTRESEKLSYETTSLVKVQNALGNNTNEGFFQTLFVYENYPVEKIAEVDNLINDFIGDQTNNYPLSVKGVSREKLSICFTYDGYYYNEETINTLLKQFEKLTLQLISTPDATMKKVCLISEQEKQQLLIDFNNTDANYPQDKCIHELFIEQVTSHPDKPALVYQEETLSYQQLYDKSHALALYLQSSGVKPDSLVGLCVERSPAMMVGILGILQAGGAYVPLDPDLPDDRLTYMLEDSQASIVLTQEKLRDKLSTLVAQDTHLIALDRQWSEISDCVADLRAKEVALEQQVTADNLAYVIYTSGSTGQPKGVMIEHGMLVDYCYSVFHKMDLQSCETFASVSTFSADLGNTALYVPLIFCKTLHLFSNAYVNDPVKLKASMDKQAIDCMKITPSHFEMFKISETEIVASSKVLIFAGEPLTKKIVETVNTLKPDCRVFNNYGPTETTVSKLATSELNSAEITSIYLGEPLDNTQVYILDTHGQPQPVGVPGELHIAGSGVARGYLNRPELTEEKFISNPFNPGTRMYKTGDLARWQGDGNVEYLGRIDTQVKIRGFRIEVGEIEAQLSQYPEIKDSAVIVLGDEGDKKLIAYYVAKDSREGHIVHLVNEEIRTWLQRTLPDYMIPVASVSLESLPLTPSGKIDRQALESMDVSLESSNAYLAPRNTTEEQLVAIWAEVLKLEPEKIGVNDNFFELGGNSLLAMQIIFKIRHQLKIDVSLKALFSANTLAGVSEVVLAIKTQNEKPMPDADLTNVEFEEIQL